MMNPIIVPVLDELKELRILVEKNASLISSSRTKSYSPKFYSRRQTAIRLGVSIGMIDKLAAEGKLNKKKIGSKTVFEVAEVENLAA